jgi:hypothetical protein
MSAMLKKNVGFKLFKRDKADTVKARAYLGAHEEIIRTATSKVSSKNKAHIYNLINI